MLIGALSPESPRPGALLCAHLPLPAVASPNTLCCGLAAPPPSTTSPQPLLTSLFPPSLSLVLSGLMNGLAGL